LLFGLQLSAEVILRLITGIFGIDAESVLYETGTMLIDLLASALVIFIGYKKSRKKFGEVFAFKNVSLSLWIAITIFMSGFIILSSELDNILEYFLPMPEFLQEVFERMLGNEYIIISVLSVGIIPAFVEEMLFRGVILSGFKENYSRKKAIITSSLLFGIMHLNPWQFVTAFILGMVSAWVCLKIKSLSISIYLHLFNNITVVLVMKTSGIITIKGFNTAYSEQAFQPLWFDITGILLASIGIIMFLNEIREVENAESVP
jgi:membrane protease YdiL (CAAX protease family)